MESMWKRIGGRKFVAFILSLAVLILLAWVNRLTDNALWGLLGLLTAFAGGNSAENLALVLKARTKVSKALSEDVEPEP